jgi:hypothetical protein
MSKVKPLWTRYRVRWDFLTKLCGSVPADPVLIKPWLESRRPTARPAGARSIDEINEEVLTTVEGALSDDSEHSMLVFQRFNGDLVMRAGTIRAHMKDCARQISSLYVGKIEGLKSYAVRCINGVYLPQSPYWIPILKDGDRIQVSDGSFDKACRGTVRGQSLSFLKNIEYVNGASLVFDVQVLGSSFSLSDLQTLFEYGGVHGYAGERGDGEGRYAYTVEPLAESISVAAGSSRDSDSRGNTQKE